MAYLHTMVDNATTVRAHYPQRKIGTRQRTKRSSSSSRISDSKTIRCAAKTLLMYCIITRLRKIQYRPMASRERECSVFRMKYMPSRTSSVCRTLHTHNTSSTVSLFNSISLVKRLHQVVFHLTMIDR